MNHVRLGSSVRGSDLVCAADARIAVSDAGTSEVGGVWKFQDEWCGNHGSFIPLFCSHLCLLACCQGSFVPWLIKYCLTWRVLANEMKNYQVQDVAAEFLV